MANIFWTAFQMLVGQLGWEQQVIGAITMLMLCLAVWAVRWNHRQRAARKPGMNSLFFIAACFLIALIAIGFGTYGLGLKAGTPAYTDDPDQKPMSGGDSGKSITQPANPYPLSILTSRYYSKKNKEDIADILDKTTDAINKQGDDIFAMAETAINRSPWDRPNEDIDPMIDRMQRIEAFTADFRRDLFEMLYKQYPDYRVELNNLLFPSDAPANFEGSAKNFRNALVVWKEHRDGLEGNQRQEFVQLVNTARSAFAGFRQDFLKWASDRQAKIAQTRGALRQ